MIEHNSYIPIFYDYMKVNKVQDRTKAVIMYKGMQCTTEERNIQRNIIFLMFFYFFITISSITLCLPTAPYSFVKITFVYNNIFD